MSSGRRRMNRAQAGTVTARAVNPRTIQASRQPRCSMSKLAYGLKMNPLEGRHMLAKEMAMPRRRTNHLETMVGVMRPGYAARPTAPAMKKRL